MRRLLLFWLPLLVGCSGGGSMDATSAGFGSAPLPPALSAVVVTADGASVTVGYSRGPFTNPASVTLTGDGFAQTLNEPPGDPLRVVFSSLDPCTAYHYAIAIDGTVLRTGAIHTLAAGGGLCPAEEWLNPASSGRMRGVNHERRDRPWCTRASWSNLYRTYPEGSAWASRKTYTMSSPGALRVGYQHYWDAGSDPFPCAERFVDSYRAVMNFELEPWRVRRLHHATATMSFHSWDGQGERAGACVNDTASVIWQNYPPTQEILNNLNDDGYSWSTVLDGPLNCWGLERQGKLVDLSTAGNQAFADVTARLTGNGPATLRLGFASADDGFPSMVATTKSFAENNDTCVTDFSNIQLHVEYAPLPPNNIGSCIATVGCGLLLVTCDSQPEMFYLHRVAADGTDGVVMWDADVARTGPAQLSDSESSYQAARYYYVCVANPSGQDCTPPLTVTGSDRSCGGSGGGGSGPTCGRPPLPRCPRPM